MSTIEFKNVSHNNILKNISGQFKSNHITALIGPSGTGKSTTLKHINGLLSPSSGDIYIDKTDIKDIDIIKLRRSIGFAFQSSPMLEGTVYDNLKFPKDLFNETFTKDEAISFLEKVNISSEFIDRPVRKLSGGEKSRVALARTLVNNPDILLLDEITASVDVKIAREIEQLILKNQKEFNLTVVWVTHDLSQAKRVSDDFWYLQNGELIEFGNIDGLNNPKSKELKKFLEGEY
ncbi:ABC transporter ATP-binding protein [Nosocomiicoccus ampullae]|uniref:ABC transporter ATP-binding protein n=1 Tax=Nosocomiicoccus ampullae TaxID=489910 RepID=UPI001C5FBAEB|nr:phosphate ABC transporter ATP-binding protein [Nosocomiicoccus ampullae]QYA48799.1 phosphate ABC transporter ATP-binding protein [Nosocomiicoccus ampullae]